MWGYLFVYLYPDKYSKISIVFFGNKKEVSEHRNMRKPFAILKRISIIFLLSMVCISLSGCIPDYCSSKYREKIEEEGRKLMTAYLDKKVSEGEMPDYELSDVHMHNGEVEGVMGKFASPLVRGTFVTYNHEFTIDVNTENKDVYWNYYEKDINDAMAEYFSEEFDIAGVNSPVVFGNLRTEYVIEGHDMENTYQDTLIDTYTTVNDVYSAQGHKETGESTAEFLRNGENTYSFDIYINSSADRPFGEEIFDTLCENNPRISYISAYSIGKDSYMFAKTNGYVNDDYMLTAKEKYLYNPSSKELKYYHYSVSEVNGACVNYVDFWSDKDGEHNNRSPLVADVENSRVFYLKGQKDTGAYFFFAQPPKGNTATTYYYDAGKKKYKKLNQYDIIQYPSGVYSLYREDDYNHGRSGFCFYSDYKVKINRK